MTGNFKIIFRAFCLSAAAIIAGNFCALVFRYSVNLPIWDDYDSVLYFLNRYTEASSFAEKITLLIDQHNEHRIFLNRALSVLSILILPQLNFAYLIYCAAAALIALSLILAKPAGEYPAACLISCAVLLQPQYGDGLNWVSAALCSFPLYLNVFICCLLAVRPSVNYLLLLPLSALALLTLGNGFLLTFCLAAFLLLEKRFKDGLLILCFGSIITGLHFAYFTHSPRAQTIDAMLADIPQLLDYGLTVAGASLGFSNKPVSRLAGAGLSALFLMVLFTPKLRRNSPYVPFLLFLFLSTALNTAARGLSSTDFAVSPGRYTILSSGIVAALSLFFYNRLLLRHSALRFAFIPAALLFNFYSYRCYGKDVEALYIRTTNDLALHVLFGGNPTYPWPDRAMDVYKISSGKGIYSFPLQVPNLGDRVSIDIPDYVRDRKAVRGEIFRALRGGEHVVIEGWGLVRNCPGSSTEIYLHLKGGKSSFTVLPKRRSRPDIAYRYPGNDHTDSGFFSVFPASWLEENELYKLEVLFQCRGKKFIKPTNHRIPG